MAKKQGHTTYKMDSPVSIISYAGVVSKKESEGPLAEHFDTINPDSTFGENSWEKAESRMQKDAMNKALEKAGISSTQIECVLAGDLLNQCTGSTFGLRELGVPIAGLYSACATIAEGLALGALLIDGKGFTKVAAITSSHFCSAERQYRFPLEYGGQRTPTAQWTVTGSGALILGQNEMPPYVKSVCIGKIMDRGITDANNMGAAMAPAASQTISDFFKDTCTNQDNYDLILTGDLGYVGSTLLVQLMEEQGYKIGGKHQDCGLLIYDRETQDVHAGGSGAGCSATVLASYILPKIRSGELSEVLFVATGALLSPTSVQQGQTIPAVAHLVHISSKGE